MKMIKNEIQCGLVVTAVTGVLLFTSGFNKLKTPTVYAQLNYSQQLKRHLDPNQDFNNRQKDNVDNNSDRNENISNQTVTNRDAEDNGQQSSSLDNRSMLRQQKYKASANDKIKSLEQEVLRVRKKLSNLHTKSAKQKVLKFYYQLLKQYKKLLYG